MNKKQAALEYHSRERKGKLEVVPTKPCITQMDLSLAYSPGVAEPCREIERDAELVYEYTNKGNLVGVVTNGTAILGLGDIGPLAGKPVMEGKSVLFKRFADIDAFDIELNTHDPDEIIKAVKLLEPTFGGINLEDIKAPECFYIEEELKKQLNIPVFHDDQHGTAIISGAGLLNACELVNKDMGEIKIAFNGAGASAIACAEFYILLGAKRENIIMCDSKGVIYKGRTEGMNPQKEMFAVETSAQTLADAIKGADVFVGLSIGGVVTQEMVKSMADKPIVFAMANPDPEITYEDAKAVRSDVIMATGRSDYPNQINNVLGFPFIFRGALDVRARAINEEMKKAASYALANLAKRGADDSVAKAYGQTHFRFGPEYIIPKPFDPRVLIWESVAVAKAAMESGVARINIDLEQYRENLERRLGKAREVIRIMINKARTQPKRVVFPEGSHEKIILASQILVEENIALPILLGREEVVKDVAKSLDVNLGGIEIDHPRSSPKFEKYLTELYNLRNRKGVTLAEARGLMRNNTVYGCMMVHMNDADALLAGVTQNYPDTIRPALQIVHVREGVSKVSGVYAILRKNKVYFFADATVNIDPSEENLAEIAIETAHMARRFGIEPRVAMLSFSNFGSTKHPLTEKVRRATEIVKKKAPDLIIDGEVQADTAVTPEIIAEMYPFSTLKGEANVLIFPDLQSGNIAYKLMQKLGDAEAIGPILMGMKKPVHVLQRGCEVKDIVNMAAIAVVEAQEIGSKERSRKGKVATQFIAST
ncbi:MAG TPA: phosphate acetyltransferase [Thermodesulfobacteriota bacterium]|nr:phosphate acetyltransferase [Thermodesulfobacteriota bacterium]